MSSKVLRVRGAGGGGAFALDQINVVLIARSVEAIERTTTHLRRLSAPIQVHRSVIEL